VPISCTTPGATVESCRKPSWSKAVDSLEQRLLRSELENARLRSALHEIANSAMEGQTAELLMTLRKQAAAALDAERGRARDDA
jgi:hypothetical protein